MPVDRRNNFDLIRLLAALQVVQGHAAAILPEPSLPRLLLASFPGVAIFFIVSGFVVSWSFLYGSGGVLGFYSRRALRIYPGLWTLLTVVLLALAVTGSIAAVGTGHFLAWLAVTFPIGAEIYGNNIIGNLIDPAGFYQVFPAGTTWTIPVELGFYALLPIILAGPIRRHGLTLASLLFWLLISVAVLAAYQFMKGVSLTHPATKILSILPLTYLWQFILGALCAVYWGKIKPLFEGGFLWWFGAYLLAAVVDAVFFHVYSFDTGTLSPLLLIRAVLLTGVVVSFAFTWRTLASHLHGHDFSYGIYLYHMPVIYTLLYSGFYGSYWLWAAVLTGTFTLAALSWLLVERPALRLKKHIPSWIAAATKARRSISPFFAQVDDDASERQGTSRTPRP